ncbi:MAG: CxxxxCH/CxxCH domain-containing protein [bacterium]
MKIDNSCRTCHTNPEGPEACNTCHGAFAEDVNDLHNVAPPAGLNNETDPTSPAVGAHQTHLAFFEAVEATCRECHTLPESMAAAGHIDADGQADVLFQGVLALTTTEGGARVPSPAFDPATNGCENTYCHGNWGLPKSGSQNPFFFAEEKMQGNNATPVWNDPETGACGTCHDLPPKGHNPFALNECANCHLDIINREGEFIDKSVHVNGKINVFRLEYPMF